MVVLRVLLWFVIWFFTVGYIRGEATMGQRMYSAFFWVVCFVVVAWIVLMAAAALEGRL